MSVASHHFNVSATAQQSLASRLNFKKSLLSGRTSFGLFINSASPTIAEQMTQAGYDWLLIDAQHSSLAPPQLQAMLGAALVNNTSALVRVNSPYDRNGIQQAIDLGAYGCMIPTIKSKEDVSAAVDSLFFPPIGSRSIAFPIRPQLGRGVQEYLNAANDEVVNVIQIETKSSLEKLEEVRQVYCTPTRVILLQGR
jgi:4-hydroxy-2-oxoheptanedioate aldolase